MLSAEFEQKEDGTMDAVIRVTGIRKPKLAANNSKFVLVRFEGEIDHEADCDGKMRRISCVLSLFCRVPRNQKYGIRKYF